jgi:hypothetical protein
MRSGPSIPRKYTVSYLDRRLMRTKHRAFVTLASASGFAEKLKIRGEQFVEIIDRRQFRRLNVGGQRSPKRRWSF